MISFARRVKARINLIFESHGMSPLPDQKLPEISFEELGRIKKQFPRPKFFIMGHARSGTTLLGRLVRLHPDVHCNWQMQFFSDRGMVADLVTPEFQSWLNHPSNRWTQDFDPTPSLLRLACDYILEQEAEKEGKWIVGDKSVNGNGGQAVEWLSSIYPDARLIYIVRDGRDTVLSKRVQLFVDQPQFLAREDRRLLEKLRSAPDAFLSNGKSIFTPRWLEDAAAKWVEDVNESIAEGRRLFKDAFHLIRFEDLIYQPVDVMTNIWTFLEAGEPGDGLEQKLHAELAKNPSAEWHESLGLKFIDGLPRGVHGGWKQVFTDADEELFKHIAGRLLEEFEYI